MSVNWSELHIDLLIYIMDKLLIDDLVRCGVVCCSWRTSVRESYKKRKQRNKPINFLPFLLFSPYDLENRKNPVNKKNRQRSLYSLTNKTIYNFQVRVPRKKHCRGSGFGWLITMERKGDRSFSVELCNPFLLNNSIINLPSLDNIVELEHKEPYKPPQLYLRKAVLSASPDSATNNYAVLAIVGCRHKLAFWRPGKKDWSLIEWKEPTQYADLPSMIRFVDVIYSTHTQQFYAIHDSEAVFVVDISRDTPTMAEIAPPIGILARGSLYIAETSNGELLKVRKRYHSHGDQTSFTYKLFEVVRLGPEKQWEEMDSLNGSMLFVGYNSSTLVASDVPGCQPNCIYFTDDRFFSNIHEGFQPDTFRTGVFDMQNQSDKLHCPMTFKTFPIWLQPTLILE